MRHNRRDFLRLLGLTVGATLAGCGSSGGGGTGFAPGLSPVPNAYQFVPLVNSGNVLPRRRKILAQGTDDGKLPFIGAVMVNDRRNVCFHAHDEAGLKGVYQLLYDGDGDTDDVKAVMEEGQTLPDGTLVGDISVGDINNSNDCAFIVTNTEGYESMQYSDGGEPFERFFTPYDDL